MTAWAVERFLSHPIFYPPKRSLDGGMARERGSEDTAIGACGAWVGPTTTRMVEIRAYWRDSLPPGTLTVLRTERRYRTEENGPTAGISDRNARNRSLRGRDSLYLPVIHGRFRASSTVTPLHKVASDCLDSRGIEVAPKRHQFPTQPSKSILLNRCSGLSEVVLGSCH